MKSKNFTAAEKHFEKKRIQMQKEISRLESLANKYYQESKSLQT
jgi:hypothetical protein